MTLVPSTLSALISVLVSSRSSRSSFMGIAMILRNMLLLFVSRLLALCAWKNAQKAGSVFRECTLLR
jgi:hypothetical protein